MKRIATIAFAAAISTLTLSAAQAGAINGISPNGLGSSNGLDTANGIVLNGIPTYNGINVTNGIILNGLGSSNGIISTNAWSNGLGGTNGISVSETAGQAILEIRLPDGTVGRR